MRKLALGVVQVLGCGSEYFTRNRDRIRQVVEGFGLKEYLGRAEKLRGDSIQKVSETEEVSEQEENEEAHEKRLFKNQAMTFSKQLRDIARALRYAPEFKNVLLFSGGIPNAALLGGSEAQFFMDPIVDSGDVVLRDAWEKMSQELASAN